MKILILSFFCEPEPNAHRGIAFGKSLQERGHEVEVLTGYPNYPGGELYAGYKMRLASRESVGGVSVIRVPLYPSHDKSGIKRVITYLTFAASAVLPGVFLIKRPDVIYVFHPPLTIGVAAVVIGALRRAPFVYDVQDVWPDSLAATGMLNNERLLKVVGSVANWVYRRASRVVVPSDGMARLLEGRGVPGSKLDVIHNWCDESQVQVRADLQTRQRLSAGARFNVVFAGNLGMAQGLEAVLFAADIVRESDARIQFVFVGDGVAKGGLERAASEMGLENVIFMDRLPPSEIGMVLEAADILLVHLRDDPLFRSVIPSKTQAYLSAGKPVLMAVRGDGADLISRSGGGVSCAPEDPTAIAEAVLGLAAMPSAELWEMGRRGAAFYGEELSMGVGTRKFEETFRCARG